MEFSVLVLATTAVVLFALWHFLRDHFVSSPLDNLPGPSSRSFLQGHIQDIFAPRGWKFLKELSEKYGPVAKLEGILGARVLIVYDPKAMHSMLIKDADAYPKCTAPFDEFMLFLGPSVFTTDGGQHRRQRKQLNPVFSAAHLRNMTPLFYDIAHRVRKALEYRVASAPGGEVVDVNGWMARTTLEMLGQATLGYSFDNFLDESTDAFGESLKAFFPTYSRIALVGFLIPPLSYFLPQWVCRALLRAIPHADIRKMMHISDTMGKRSLDIINEKKMALLKGGDVLRELKVGESKDLMSILLKANLLSSEADRLTDEELVAQVSTFILAGMDTTSNALTRILQVLAEHPAEQEKLPYLDAVCRETLRVYSPVNVIGRGASRDMRLPLFTPVLGSDGLVVSEVAVPQGTWLLANIQASNCNRTLWGEDAYEWKPERWLKPFPASLENARIPGVYSNLMSFSGGSRSCIGFKFSQLEMKIVLSILVTSFKFETTGKTITWNTSGVSYPTMGEGSDKPELLLKVNEIARMLRVTRL